MDVVLCRVDHEQPGRRLVPPRAARHAQLRVQRLQRRPLRRKHLHPAVPALHHPRRARLHVHRHVERHAQLVLPLPPGADDAHGVPSRGEQVQAVVLGVADQQAVEVGHEGEAPGVAELADGAAEGAEGAQEVAGGGREDVDAVLVGIRHEKQGIWVFLLRRVAQSL